MPWPSRCSWRWPGCIAPAWTVPRPKLLPATHPHASQLRFSPLSQPSPLHAPRARRSTNFQRQHKVPPTQRHTTRLASESCSHRKLCCPCVPRVLAPHHTVVTTVCFRTSRCTLYLRHSKLSTGRCKTRYFIGTTTTGASLVHFKLYDARTTTCDARPPRDHALHSPWLDGPIGRQVVTLAQVGDHGQN